MYLDDEYNTELYFQSKIILDREGVSVGDEFQCERIGGVSRKNYFYG
jgi:hypothetical protein